MRKAGFLLTLILIVHTAVSAQSYGDYTLYSPKNNSKAYLVNLSGATYHTWTMASNKPTGYSTYLLPGGILLRTVARSGNYFTGGPICGEVQKVDWNGNVIWDYVYSTTEYCSHHDICPMPNGNVLLIAYETRTPSQVSAAGCSQSITMWPDKIVEIEPVGTNGGNVVWEWHSWDHLSQSLYPAKANYVSSIVMHPELLNINYKTQKDWLHVNGLDYNPILDQITFSSHAMNEIYVIDHSTTTAEAASHSGGNSGKGGDLLYRWGNPEAYQAAGSANFNVVHDAHWIPQGCPNANNLVGFNNMGGAGGKTCVDIIAPPYDGYNYSGTPGQAYAPSTYSQRVTYSGTPTSNEGNSQQLPNGNMLINISFSGYMYEIDPNQNVVWSKTISGINTSAFRYTDCYVNSIGYADATASPEFVCEGGSTQLNAEGIGGSNYIYSWTSSPAGFTSSLKNPSVSPSATTTYYVTITSGTCTATDSVKVEVVPYPAVPTITAHADSLISSWASENQWYREGTLLGGATNWYYIPTQPGNYQVAASNGNGCNSDLSASYFFTSLEDDILNKNISIYPNPTTGLVNIEVPAGMENYSLHILNLQGKILLNEPLKNQTTDLSNLESGIYVLQLFQDQQLLKTSKIVLIK